MINDYLNKKICIELNLKDSDGDNLLTYGVLKEVDAGFIIIDEYFNDKQVVTNTIYPLTSIVNVVEVQGFPEGFTNELLINSEKELNNNEILNKESTTKNDEVITEVEEDNDSILWTYIKKYWSFVILIFIIILVIVLSQ